MTKISGLPDGSATIAADDLLPFVDVSETGAARNKCVLVGALAGAALGWINVRDSRYGATGDGVTNDTTAIAAALAALLAVGYGTLYFPAGTYLVDAGTLVVDSGSYIELVGDGFGASVLTPSAASTSPLLKLTTTGRNVLVQGLRFLGNGLTGATGNGHAIAILNLQPGAGSSVFQPQHTMMRDVEVVGFRGNALDETGASMSACGYYAFGATVHGVENSLFFQCGTGIRLKSMFKHQFFHVTVDQCDQNAVYLDSCENVDLHGCTLNGSGSAGTDDGLLHARNCYSVNLFGGRLKNGNPYLVNLGGSAYVNTAIHLHGVSCEQLDAASGHTAVRVGTGQDAVSVTGCDFLFLYSMTNAIGIDAAQGAAGRNLCGLTIRDNSFNIGDGGTITAMVRINIGTNKCVSPIIEGNTFGNQAAAGSATTYTSGVELGANVSEAIVRNNSFVVSTNKTMTNAVLLSAGSATGTQILQNYYTSIAGAITNQVVSSGGAEYMRWEGDTIPAGAMLRLANSTSFKARNNAGTGNIDLVSASTGDAVIIGGTNAGNLIFEPNNGTAADAVILDSLALYPNSDTAVDLGKAAQRYGALFLSGQATVQRVKGGGTAHVAGDYTLSAGWGAAATVSTIAAKDSGGRVSITCSGAGIAANPTVTLTFKDGTWTTVPAVVCSNGANVAPTTGFWALTAISATAATWTFVGLPVAASVYVLDFITMGK